MRGIYHKTLESTEPELNSPLDGEILADPRNDDFAATVGGDVLKFSILCEENHLFFCHSLPEFGIFNSSLTKDNDMFGIIPCRPELSIERQREIFIQEDLQEACSTAGGTCSAT